MPNIEIHGLNVMHENNFVFHGHSGNCRGLCVRERIEKIFANWPCSEDMVITIVPSDTKNLKGENQPFVRVCDTDSSRGLKIAKRLRLEGFDVEFLKLKGFLPGSMYLFKEIQMELECLKLGGFKYCKPPYDDICAAGSIWLKMALAERYSQEKPPTAEELAQKVKGDPSKEASRAQFIRWTQMLNILECK